MLCVFWGAVCGVAGSAVGCPLYMVKTQMQAQSHGQFAVGFQHNHSGMVNALISTYHTQGMRGLWRGFEGIVPRTAVGSAVQMTTFTTAKDYLSNYEVCTALACLDEYHALKPIFFLWAIADISTVHIFDSGSIKHDKWIIFSNWNDTV